jgi:RHS repeat-associated protein
LFSAVDGNGTNYASSATYWPAGSLNTLLNGSIPALNSIFQYNPRLQLCRITTLTSGTVPASCTDAQHIGNVMDRGNDFHLSAGNNGNVFAITNYRDSTRSQTFTYDALNRLTSGWSSANTGAYSWGENYTIDAWGNLQIAPTGNKVHGGYFPNASDVTNRPLGFGYDAAGNMTNYTAPGQYVYDPENRLSSTAGTTYTYDGNGERVLKSQLINNVLTPVKRYWSMGGNTLAEGDGSGNLTAEYIYFGGKRVARIDLPANTVHYYLSDHLGSTSIVASATGVVEEESDYYPFGTEVLVTVGANHYKFTGKERDAESGLDNFGARYYASALGRFMSPDWSEVPEPVPYADLSDPQTLNLYAYVRNNPLNRADLDGHCGWLLRFSEHVCNKADGLGWRTNAEVDKAAKDAKKNLPGMKTIDPATGKVTEYTKESVAGMSREQLVQTADNIRQPTAYELTQINFGMIGGSLARDQTGKVHGDLPKSVPEKWTREQMEEAASELRESIKARNAEQGKYGEEGGHRERIRQEEQLLRQVEKKLSGS